MKINNPAKGRSDLINEQGLTSEEFIQIVHYFHLLRLARDNKYTQCDAVELINDLNYPDNEIKRLLR